MLALAKLSSYTSSELDAARSAPKKGMFRRNALRMTRVLGPEIDFNRFVSDPVLPEDVDQEMAWCFNMTEVISCSRPPFSAFLVSPHVHVLT